MQERRAHPRKRCYKGAKVEVAGGGVFDAVVRNVSDGGAMLAMPSTLGVPSAFVLAVHDEPPRACRVAWREADRMGVAFG